MTPNLPLCCTTPAFRLLSKQLPTINSPDALLNGAIAIALHQMEDADVASVDTTIQKFADTVRSRVRGNQPQARIVVGDYNIRCRRAGAEVSPQPPGPLRSSAEGNRAPLRPALHGGAGDDPGGEAEPALTGS